MKTCSLKTSSVLAFSVMGVFILSPQAASNPPGFGKNLEEVAGLALKEGNVRIGLGFVDKKSRERVLTGFFKKYPGIKVEHSTVNSRNREKVFSEALAGGADYDVVDISVGVQTRWRKADILSGPFEWSRLSPNAPEEHFSPDGYFAAGAVALGILAYNPSLVSPGRVPRKWEDCLDSYWKGKFVVDTKPRIFARFYPSWGEARLIEYAKKLKDNQPIWIRGITSSPALLSAGEVSMICGSSYSSFRRMLNRDPQAKLGISWPKEVPAGVNKSMGVLKGAKSPNAALLLASWLASLEGAKGYDDVGYGSPFIEGTHSWKVLKKARAKVTFGGWAEAQYRSVVEKKIIAAWGFP